MEAVWLGVGAAVVVLCSRVSSLNLMNLFLPLKFVKNDLEKYCKMLRRHLASIVPSPVGKVEACGNVQMLPPQTCPAAQNGKGAYGHLSLSEGTLYGLQAACRFGSSRGASHYL